MVMHIMIFREDSKVVVTPQGRKYLKWLLSKNQRVQEPYSNIEEAMNFEIFNKILF